MSLGSDGSRGGLGARRLMGARAPAKWPNIRFGHGRLSPRVARVPGVVATGGGDRGVGCLACGAVIGSSRRIGVRAQL